MVDLSVSSSVECTGVDGVPRHREYLNNYCGKILKQIVCKLTVIFLAEGVLSTNPGSEHFVDVTVVYLIALLGMALCTKRHLGAARALFILEK